MGSVGLAQFKFKGRVGVVIATFLALSAATGCGKKGDEKDFAGIACGEAPDQYQSYMNPMDSTVVQTISIDSSFTAEEVSKIEAAVAVWNADGRRVLGRNIFVTQIIGLSSSSTPNPSEDCGFPGISSGFSIVKITNQSTWSALGFAPNNPGVTVRCSSGTEFTQKQVVLINTENMRSYPEVFQNVMLHELGHSIGLDHSCDGSNRGNPSFAGCSGLSSTHSYREAVMYPFIDSSNLKENLRSNDEVRSACALNYRP